jgi:hypothetical protein
MFGSTSLDEGEDVLSVLAMPVVLERYDNWLLDRMCSYCKILIRSRLRVIMASQSAIGVGTRIWLAPFRNLAVLVVPYRNAVPMRQCKQ